MALKSKSRQSTLIWPGFVDALSVLLLVLIFLLTIFMVVQFMLRETIMGQKNELNDLSAQLDQVQAALGLSQTRGRELDTKVAGLEGDLTERNTLISSLTSDLEGTRSDLSVANLKITNFEAQVAGLISERDTALAAGEALTAARDQLLTEKEALDLALATARKEIDKQTEEARLAAAKSEAYASLVAEINANAESQRTALAETNDSLSQAEKDRLAEAAAAEELRKRLENSTAELTAMSLSLEEERKKAEETLTLLAAARSAKANAESVAILSLDEIDQKDALLKVANDELAKQSALSAEAQRQAEALNLQTAELRKQLDVLQGLVDASAAKDSEAQVRIDSLGSEVNAALARAASEEKKRRELEEAERKRAEAEAAEAKSAVAQLEGYRSEFFGKLRNILGNREGVQIVGDRFVFSSEVLFQPASAVLSPAGKEQIARVAGLLSEVAVEIPPEVNWIIRVDGHTDKVPLSGTGLYKDNWELSQARALSVVKYMTDELGFDPKRLAATGFAEFQPLDEGDSPEALARNRRIELKLTER
ncbi:MAG: peptidoglycan -binding protein [Deltaproteobacteria bacterium]